MTQKKDKSTRARDIARTTRRAQILSWYMDNNDQQLPITQCEDIKPYGTVLWWLEPPPKHTKGDNFLLVEETLGDSWTMRTELIRK